MKILPFLATQIFYMNSKTQKDHSFKMEDGKLK